MAHASRSPQSALESALTLAASGVPVVPLTTPADGGCSCRRGPNCPASGKHPRLTNWRQAATVEAAQIEHSFTKWPDANVGGVGGIDAGVVIVDVDVHRGGGDSLAALHDLHGALPPTVEVVTGSGGRHLWFEHPGDRRIAGGVDKVAPGIDLVADGQLAVSPRSVHASGRTYEWVDGAGLGETPLAPFPGWMQPAAPEPLRPRRDDRAVHRGMRNVTLTKVAGMMRFCGVAPEAIAPALHEHNRSRCIPPLPDPEVERIAGSISRRRRPPRWITHLAAFIADPLLAKNSRTVLTCIVMHARSDGSAFLGYRRIREVTAVPKNSVAACVDQLAEAGRIRSVRRSGGFRCVLVDALPEELQREGQGGVALRSPLPGQRAAARRAP